MIYYILPDPLVQHVSKPEGAPIVIEVANLQGDTIRLTVHDWVYDQHGVMVLARLTDDGLDAPEHRYVKFVADEENLIEWLSTWGIRSESYDPIPESESESESESVVDLDV